MIVGIYLSEFIGDYADFCIDSFIKLLSSKINC